MNQQSLKNRLPILRLEKKLSQLELANALSVSRQTINSIENLRYEPSLFLAMKLATYFDKKIEEIFWVEEN